VFAAALALAAAASWGVGDFLGGVKSRTLAPIAVMIVAQPVGLATAAILVVVRGHGFPTAGVFWASLAACFGTTGLIAFYRGMAAGALTIVAPIAGAGAVIPVLWDLAHGHRPGTLRAVGFVTVLGGVILASWERRPDTAAIAAGAGWAVIAMLAFGAYYVPMHTAAQTDWGWAAFVFRATSMSLVLTAWLVLRPRNAQRADIPTLASIGFLDTGGNILFAAAASRGLVSVVSVLGSLYPVGTVLLARAVLHERVQRTQELGILLALVGVVLVSVG
jgi:drug/metabolite transporter (DMT)-like permease